MVDLVAQENNMDIYNEYFITVNNKNKVQVAHTILEERDSQHYIIKRYTGQHNGKFITQPEIYVNLGKASRNVYEQSILEYNSIVKKYLDKGYKNLSWFTNKMYHECEVDEMIAWLGSVKTDQNNAPKPMLAISHTKCASSSFNKTYFASNKLDGVRCLMFMKDGEIKTASRGGKNYDSSTKHIREDEQLIALFKEYPDLILDGELYHHGYPLQKLSGIARLEDGSDRCKILQYHIYDIITDEVFEYRVKTLEALKEFESEYVKIVDHQRVVGWMNIKHLHDEAVSNGYEGLVIRNHAKEYGIGKRSSIYMIKVKEYIDKEFKVLDIELGLRGIEDMVFVCETKDYQKFRAKPMGDLAVKQEYYENFETKYKNKQGTVKYFNMSEDGIPTQPVFKAFRGIEDL